MLKIVLIGEDKKSQMNTADSQTFIKLMVVSLSFTAVMCDISGAAVTQSLQTTIPQYVLGSLNLYSILHLSPYPKETRVPWSPNISQECFESFIRFISAILLFLLVFFKF